MILRRVHLPPQKLVQSLVARQNDGALLHLDDAPRQSVEVGPNTDASSSNVRQREGVRVGPRRLAGDRAAPSQVLDADAVNLKNVYHGVETSIKIINHEKLFQDIPENIMVGRYHSWVVKHPLPTCLKPTSFDKKGHLMSLRHKNYKVYGVQFHPESILTKYGKKILQNWIND